MRFKRWERDLVIKAVAIVLILLAMIAARAHARTVVCVLDSGVNPDVKAVMCDKTFELDTMNHGTHVAETIAMYAGNNYCIKSYKVFYSRKKSANLATVLDGLGHCDVINLSIDSDKESSIEEYMAFWRASHRAKMFISAGNAGKDLNKERLFPVGYSLIPWTVVGNTSNVSNTGSLVTQIEDRCVNKFCGTSASVAIATGKYVKSLLTSP